MMIVKSPRKKRRRNCWDRLRAQMIARQRRRGNPAASPATQLAALFAVLFGRMPLMPPAFAPYVAPPMSPGHARRLATARHLGIPSRYVDIVLAQGTVPYGLLFEHVRRGGKSRDDAMSLLRRRAPASCREWLDYVERRGLWSNLLLCHVRGASDEDTDVRLLSSTLAWLSPLDAGAGEHGPADAGAALNPGPDGNDPGPGNGPTVPRP